MKNLFLVVLIVLFTACEQKEQAKEKTQQNIESFPEKAKDMTIYEVNIRQYTAEGTIKAFIPHIKRLKDMGIEMLWLMPIQPIGEKERKGSLGSYYSIKDYTAVNPEFGSLADFKELVNTAHEHNIVVLLDWVANHSAFDHYWATEHPDYYTRDSLGNMIPPVQDWSDVADLNYDNDSLRKDMKEAMKFWLTEADIDGFRCDVAGMVPADFWENAIKELREVKNIFMLAEDDTPEIHDAGFDMSYGWEFLHLTNEIAKGEKNANDLEAYLNKEDSLYDPEDIKMYFTTNHDENSWSGTVFQRLDTAYRAITLLTFTLEGMPLVYSGQESGLNKSLAFFDKDTIVWDELPYQDWFTQLISLKKENPELWNAKYGGDFERISTSNAENIFAFSRKTEDQELIVIVNLSNEFQRFGMDEAYQHTYRDLLTNFDITFDSNEFSMKPWSYYVLQQTDNI